MNYMAYGLYLNKADKNKAKANILLNDEHWMLFPSRLETRQGFLF